MEATHNAPRNATKRPLRRVVLVDTADWSDAILTGRDGVEDLSHGEPGLRIAYDFSYGHPSVTLNGPDGEIMLSGIAEINYAANALSHGARMAETDLKRNTN